MLLIVVVLLVRLGVLMVTCTRAVAATARGRRHGRARAAGADGTGCGQAEVSERQLVADRMAGILGQRSYREAMEALAGAEESLGALWVPQLRDE